MDEMGTAGRCSFHYRMGDEMLYNECRSSLVHHVAPYRRRMVKLPVSTTEGWVVGTLDLERTLKEGVYAFEPDLLAQANGSTPYVGEINLLESHIMDVLLSSATMGISTAERKGISCNHPARFILVDTISPEEGSLQPQLLNRFGLMTKVHDEREAETYKGMVRRCPASEENPAAFYAY